MSNLATACSAQRQVCCRAQILEGLKKKAAPNSPKNYMYVYPLFQTVYVHNQNSYLVSRPNSAMGGRPWERNTSSLSCYDLFLLCG